jgi:hypothetical protein
MSTFKPIDLNQSTRFRPPNGHGVHRQSRSPVRSPIHKVRFAAQEIDPLLADLTPQSTFWALSVTGALDKYHPHNTALLSQSIVETSTAERAYGIRAAVGAQKLREWFAEIRSWKWPAKKESRLGHGFLPRSASSAQKSTQCEMNSLSGSATKTYAGCLPLSVVTQHEARIEEIKDGLEALGVEELKDHILASHRQSSDREEVGQPRRPGRLTHVSGFTAIVTETILLALPYLSKLKTLLDTWDIRIMVLKEIPSLLPRLEKMESAVGLAFERLSVRRPGDMLTRSDLETTRLALRNDISSLGGIIDRMLDLLEGVEDCLPAIWIDRMDKIQSDLAHWTVEAERLVFYNEWMAQNQVSSPQEYQDAPLPVRSIDPMLITDGVPGAAVEGQSAVASPVQAGDLDQKDHGPLEPGGSLSEDINSGGQPPHGSIPEGIDPAPGSKFPSQTIPIPPESENLRLASVWQSKEKPALDLGPAQHHRHYSEISIADSMASDALSDLSNAEIASATTAKALGSPMVISHTSKTSRDEFSDLLSTSTPRVRSMQISHMNLHPAGTTEKSHHRAISMPLDRVKTLSPPSSTTVSNALVEKEENGRISSPSPDKSIGRSISRPRPTINRASISSIEKVPKNRIRSIMVSRRDSSSSSVRSPISSSGPNDSIASSGSVRSMSPPETTSPTPSGQHEMRPESFEIESQNDGKFQNADGHDDQHHHMAADDGIPPLDQMSSQMSIAAPSTEHGTPKITLKKPFSEAGDMQSDELVDDVETKGKGGRRGADLFESKIQGLLTRIPVRIRLVSEQYSEISSSASASAANSRSTSPAPSLTLRPVKTARRPARSSNNSNAEIRMFHLSGGKESQTGPPVKLCVRLVGEQGERVMVRVGGGWVDLGDYLRDYSLHRPSRSLGRGTYELASVPLRDQKHGANDIGSIALEAGDSYSGTSGTDSKITARGSTKYIQESRQSTVATDHDAEHTIPSALKPSKIRHAASLSILRSSHQANLPAYHQHDDHHDYISYLPNASMLSSEPQSSSFRITTISASKPQRRTTIGAASSAKPCLNSGPKTSTDADYGSAAPAPTIGIPHHHHSPPTSSSSSSFSSSSPLPHTISSSTSSTPSRDRAGQIPRSLGLGLGRNGRDGHGSGMKESLDPGVVGTGTGVRGSVRRVFFRKKTS